MPGKIILQFLKLGKSGMRFSVLAMGLLRAQISGQLMQLVVQLGCFPERCLFFMRYIFALKPSAKMALMVHQRQGFAFSINKILNRLNPGPVFNRGEKQRQFVPIDRR